MSNLFQTIAIDIRLKAKWNYGNTTGREIARALMTDGTAAMILYRLMQWSRRRRLTPLEMIVNKLNSVFCGCIIGRGADFGPGLVLIHSNGVVINGRVRGGCRIYIEHQVTIGAERGQSPILGNDLFIGAGAKIVGPVRIGNGCCVGANAVVVDDVPDHATVAGIPARVVGMHSQDKADKSREPAD
jgi:serine O-acetyltransferase